MNSFLSYPTTFTEALVPLTNDDAEAATLLTSKGFEVVSGMRRSDTAALSAMARQPGIQEYCPKDPVSRLADEATAEAWLPTKGGHGMYLLRRLSDQAIVGYGWSRLAGIEKLPIPDYRHTFAVRLDAAVSGQGLARPFSSLILSDAAVVYGATHVGLETWGSNTGAVRTYLHLGAELVSTKDDYRPTLQPSVGETEGRRRDVRLYMRFPQTF